MKILMYCPRHHRCVNNRWRNTDARPSSSAMPPIGVPDLISGFLLVENAGLSALGQQGSVPTMYRVTRDTSTA